jgi:hypothetical protein
MAVLDPDLDVCCVHGKVLGKGFGDAFLEQGVRVRAGPLRLLPMRGAGASQGGEQQGVL